MQTAATQTLSYFDKTVQVADVIREVPVYIDEKGHKIGTSPGHLASYFAKKGYNTTAYIFDTELFDRSWGGMTSASVITNLRDRQKAIPDNSWLAKYHHILVEGWELYAKAGGHFVFSGISGTMLHNLLDHGPYLISLNSTYLNGKPKQRYDTALDKFVDDAISGRSLTHGTTCAGYKDNKFLIVDPDPPEGTDQHRWIEQDHLIASIMAAQTESDNLLISITK